MSQVRIIKTEREHEQALERLTDLLGRNPAATTPESDELDLLALVIEHYEREHYPIDSPDPIEAIKFRMDQMGLTRKDLARYLGSTSKISEILKGKRPLSLNMIRKLSTSLGISADILIREPTRKVVNT